MSKLPQEQELSTLKISLHISRCKPLLFNAFPNRPRQGCVVTKFGREIYGIEKYFSLSRGNGDKRCRKKYLQRVQCIFPELTNLHRVVLTATFQSLPGKHRILQEPPSPPANQINIFGTNISLVAKNSLWRQQQFYSRKPTLNFSGRRCTTIGNPGI